MAGDCKSAAPGNLTTAGDPSAAWPTSLCFSIAPVVHSAPGDVIKRTTLIGFSQDQEEVALNASALFRFHLRQF
jgi:hypothetical protein